MLSLRPRKFLCEIYEHHLVLRCAGNRIGECEITDDATLEEAVDGLIAPHIGRVPWRDTLGFWLESSRVHHFTVPWQEGITNPEDFRGYAASLAIKQWPGEPERSLKTDFISVNYASTALAATIDDRLWQILLRIGQQRKLRVEGIAIEFQVQLHPWLRQLPQEALFCLRGAHSSIYAARQQGEWHQVWRLNNDSDGDAQRQLALVARLMGLDNNVPRHFLNAC
ncbi:hypothetical protein FEI17_20525 [Kosakonia radicincitans]|uniref:hypothetical protein n=1 Tax=Kosakonia TaxID=1330547 RepID=UPI00046158DB|nr:MULTISPECIES: hypothetical protein [Kosakonia]APG16835.1 hypothetical protein A3780_04390 [Kosakonia radicincitans]KDE36151.1 hypothetical protein AW40_12955 [Kosakonia radicincitans UMEnt01/12]MDD7994054.1 hypothetical protein [Kosakonia radicincitans]PTA93780.1 hypothetical protein CWM66_07175 [Kosakonia sp. H7A]QEM92867.1 hypothetical protein FEI17_20525 [Kosakonia radicincitans]